MLNTTTQQQQQDFLSILFNNSLAQMLMSTGIIAVIGVLITKLRNLKKKLDMIEVLTKAQVKFKKLADEREANFEERFIKSQEDFTQQIKDLCTKLDQQSRQTDAKIINLSEKISEVKDEATNALIQFLKENSLGSNNSNRKR